MRKLKTKYFGLRMRRMKDAQRFTLSIRMTEDERVSLADFCLARKLSASAAYMPLLLALTGSSHLMQEEDIELVKEYKEILANWEPPTDTL